jgi:hypothetical protein
MTFESRSALVFVSSYEIFAFSVPGFTSIALTPETFLNDFSMMLAQDAQCIPRIRYV